jgi:glycosyltransferase involved in cell wall biosynthesis
MTHNDEKNADRGTPRISIVMATYNAEKFLPRCLDNIRQQTYDNLELIIADGGSKDRTVEILRESGGVVDHWFSGRDRGIFDAWNKALPFVTGQWVLFRGVDDFFWDPDSLAQAARQLAGAGQGHLVAYGRMVRFDESGIITALHGEQWSVARRRFFQYMTIPHPATFQHVKAFERYGNFDISYPVAGDYEFLMRVLKDSDPLFLPDGIISGMQGGGNCDRRYRENFHEVLRARRKNGIGGVAFDQYKQLLIIFRSRARHALLRMLFGAERAGRIVTRRCQSRARRLAREAGLPSTSHPIYQGEPSFRHAVGSAS